MTLLACVDSANLVAVEQGELSKARAAADAASSQLDALRSEADSLRAALHAVEGRLTEYQEKDTEVSSGGQVQAVPAVVIVTWMLPSKSQ
jgi:hypothetical protein